MVRNPVVRPPIIGTIPQLTTMTSRGLGNDPLLVKVRAWVVARIHKTFFEDSFKFN